MQDVVCGDRDLRHCAHQLADALNERDAGGCGQRQHVQHLLGGELVQASTSQNTPLVSVAPRLPRRRPAEAASSSGASTSAIGLFQQVILQARDPLSRVLAAQPGFDRALMVLAGRAFQRELLAHPTHLSSGLRCLRELSLPIAVVDVVTPACSCRRT